MVSDEAACPVASRMGGATSYHEGACPATDDEASDLINHRGTASQKRDASSQMNSHSPGTRVGLVSIGGVAAGVVLGIGAFALWPRQRRDAPLLPVE